jgi:hypothetical protein
VLPCIYWAIRRFSRDYAIVAQVMIASHDRVGGIDRAVCLCPVTTGSRLRRCDERTDGASIHRLARAQLDDW